MTRKLSHAHRFLKNSLGGGFAGDEVGGGGVKEEDTMLYTEMKGRIENGEQFVTQ